MKKPFDRIIGPNGEWIDGDDSEKPEGVDGEVSADGLSEREEFVLRCLNAAVNLYGVVTAREFCSIYNEYAGKHSASVASELGEREAVEVARRLLRNIAEKDDSELLDVLSEDAWYTLWQDDKTGEWLFVYEAMADEATEMEQDSRSHASALQRVNRRISKTRSEFVDVPFKILPEKTFLLYEDPNGDEETSEANSLIKFLKKEYGIPKSEAEFYVWSIIAHLRVNNASLSEALAYISDTCDFGPEDATGLRRLVEALSPVVNTTRTWQYRGHTHQEMYGLGKVERFSREEFPDYFGVYSKKREDGYDDDYDEEDYDDDLGEPIDIGELPPAKYTGPVDFKFVKDPVERDRMLWDYDGVRIVTREFVRHVVIPESTHEERLDAAKRLGFPIDEERGCVTDPNLDMVAGDFATMMDDQHGEPAIKRILKRKGKLENRYDRAAAEYYENYRYTWLEVLAVKSGVGMKCRDLLTGEELFLMETSFSKGDVKGMTVCAGIAPMGSVYLVLGVIHPANFENPATILKIILTHLGLQTELPIKLSFADQARFAAETIRRINANGRFNAIAYGCADN